MPETQILNNWKATYIHIAQLLFEFRKNHSTSTGEALFRQLDNEPFKYGNPWFRQTIQTYNSRSIDPIQLFASLSHSTSSYSSRIFRINLLLEVLNSDARISDEINLDKFFDGCPTVMMSKIVISRAKEQQREIWDWFDSIMSHEMKGLTENHFLQFHTWFGINLSAFTIFLFWIKPSIFFPLDRNTKTFLVVSKVVEQVPSKYSEYIALCSRINDPEIIPDIVRIAKLVIADGEKESNFLYLKQTAAFLNQTSLEEERDKKIKELLHPFKIIALKPSNPEDVSKVLKSNYYQFYQSYEFKDNSDHEIIYTDSGADNLYYEKGNRFSVSAIVGKNGSGKSTITELLFRCINQLAIQYETSGDLIEEQEPIEADIYYYSDRLYKLCFRKGNVEIFDYESKSIEKGLLFSINDSPITETFNLKSFFYSIVINYSLYGLNENLIGSWINPLFHKNDGYQTPIVLNPKREEGIIDVNKEEKLANSRLLSAILNLDRFETITNEGLPPEDLPFELVEMKRPYILSIEFDNEKWDRWEENFEGYEWRVSLGNDPDSIYLPFTEAQISSHLLATLSYNRPPLEIKYREIIERYIVYKLVSIGINYQKFNEFVTKDDTKKQITFNGPLNLFFEKILSDKSHITVKLLQAINYLTCGHIVFTESKMNFSVSDLASSIQKARIKEEEQGLTSEELEIIRFIPPSIFKTEIFFKDGYSFDSLSSGEKQKIFALNTISYHLWNLNSIEDSDDLISYPYINILFDEVELYFHPDMQRTFIRDLLAYSGHITLNELLGINIQFITHSPFILSDIPAQNILRLNLNEEGKSEPQPIIEQTFGANIHDLLANEFFLDKGFMGDFAKEKIQTTINWLNSDRRDIKESDLHLKIIELVGEPILKRKLLEIYDFITGQNNELTYLKKRIEELSKTNNNRVIS